MTAIENFIGGLFNKRDEPLDARSFDAINNFIGNVAEDILGDHTAKRAVDERSLTAIENFFGGLFNKRDEPLDARSLTAIGNFFSSIFGYVVVD